MDPLSHKGAGAIGAPANPALPDTSPFGHGALEFSRDLPFVTADGALAVIAYAANQAVAGQVSFAHLLGELAHAQARELSTAGAQAMPHGPLRDAVLSIANLEASFANSVIDAANRYGRSFAHLAFAFPVSARRTH
jgi:hypothetical protein